jgi:PHD/YefM family antitoxin component YafN of YafNO toxin-antitoxin module
MAITTISSREFNQDTSGAKKAAEKGPVFITDRGRTAFVLMTIGQYQKIAHQEESLADLLALPEGVDICEEFDSLIPRSREIHKSLELD